MNIEAQMEEAGARWGSHLPALLACVADSGGGVLEIGVGFSSTPALHCLCDVLQRTLVSVEDNAEWGEYFKVRMEKGGHHFVIGDYDLILRDMAKTKWGTVFIDHSPGGAHRAREFKRFIKLARYVVVHDYWQENEEHIAPVLGKANWIKIDVSPPVLVATYGLTMPGSIFDLA